MRKQPLLTQLMVRLSVAAALLSGDGLVLAAEPLKTAVVELRQVDQTYATDGVVEAVRQSTVSAQISGRVVKINFDVGDWVEQGQVIVRIDPREVTQALAGSQAQVAQAQAALQQAKANWERTKGLFAQKFVSQSALDQATADYKAAQAQTEAALAGVGQAATTRGFADVVAPYSGVVAARHVELGEMAAPGKPLMTGFDPASLRVVANMPQYKLTEVRSGAAAVVEIPALNKWITATAVTVLPTVDPRTLATKVRLDLPEKLRDVYPGMYARAHFVVGRAVKLVVSAAAVLRRSEVVAVYVVDGADAKNMPRLRQVRLGEPAGADGIEVLAGLQPGESVALEPLKAGMLLQPNK